MLDTLDYRTLNPAQQSAVTAIASGKNIIISGGCKTGKSHLASVASRLLPGTLLLRGCDTNQEFQPMDSVFTYFPPQSMHTHDLPELTAQTLKKARRIVIDQASLLRCDYIDHIDRILKFIHTSNEPFGGVQLVFCCDFCIGTPFVNPQSLLDAVFVQQYGTRRFLFESDVVLNCDFKVFTLSQYFLEKSDEFIHAVKIIRLSGAINNDRACIIERAIKVALSEYESEEGTRVSIQGVCMSATQSMRLNDLALRDAPGKLYQFKAKEDGDCLNLAGLRVVSTKPGAPIIFNRTIDELSIEKGMLGTVLSCKRSKVTVLTELGHEVEIEPERWLNRKISDNGMQDDVIGSLMQMPFKNAFILHKRQIQGKNLKHIRLHRMRDDTYDLLYACLATGAVVSQNADLFTFKHIKSSNLAGVRYTIKHATA